MSSLISDYTFRRSFLARLSGWLAGIGLSRADILARPRVILLIRHGEKSGKKDDIHLNTKGNERAAALPKLFAGTLPEPEFIFATKASANSNRPFETVTPLATALHIVVNQQFANDEFPALAKELLGNPQYRGKTVLVCWHHGKLPALATALGAPGELPEWNEQQFDRVWRLDYNSTGVTFANLPQHLLPGDSES